MKSKQPPSWEFPLGTDFFGRDLYVAMVVGLKQTATIGLLAGALGHTHSAWYWVSFPLTLAGWLDTIIKGICQILTPIPALLIQVIIAGSLDKRDVTIYTMAFVVVLLAWMGPTLVIRAQVLTMKERQFVSVAKLSGMGDLGIIFSEILPNLLPFIAAAFVNQVFYCSVMLRSIWRCWVLVHCANHCLAIRFGRRRLKVPSSIIGGGGPWRRRWLWC